MANTAWSTTDKSGTVTLTNGGLTATLGAASSGVRAIDKQITGQFYFEVTATTWTGSSPIIGVANSAALLNSIGANPINACGVIQSGAIFLGLIRPPGSPSLGARANGDIIGIAVDLTNRLIWFRVAPSGNWNGTTGFAPGGTGGIDFSSIGGGGIPLFPVVAAGLATTVYTANFGGAAFSGTVPSGYTSGWPTSSIATNALITQAAVEEWITTNPTAQVTQVAVEEWGQLPPPPLWVTQAGAFDWVTNLHAPFRVTQVGAFVWVNTTAQTLSVTGIPSGATVGTPVIIVSGGPVTLSPPSIGSEEAVGTPTIVTGFVLLPAGIDSEESVGTPSISVTVPGGAAFFMHAFP